VGRKRPSKTPPFKVRTERREDATILEFTGELDLSVQEEVATALAQAIGEAPPLVLVNLQGLTFLDSTGIRCLFEAKLLVEASGMRMAILNGSGPAHRVLELTGMDDVIEMVDDPAELDPPADRPAAA
jgi:anti-sigma B factor antagonist